MIKRLRFPYDPENFDNPVIQTHYKNLDTMALEKPDVEPIEDYTSTCDFFCMVRIVFMLSRLMTTSSIRGSPSKSYV